MTMIRRFLLFLILLGLAAGAFAQTPPRLIIEAPAGLRGTAARLQALDPSRLESVMRLAGLRDPGPPVRVILAPEGSPAALGVPPWVSGYALSDRGVIVLLPGRVPSYPDSSLSDLLAHEVSHVLVARAAGGRPLPRWFHEGVAMIAGLSWGLEDHSRLTLALLTDRPVSLAALDERFGGGQSEVNRAYAIAGSFVRDLLDRYGPDVAARILAGVGRGLPFDEAFRAASGVPLAAAEASFWERQTFWYRWVPVLTSSFALWMIVTALALWAIRRRRARDAAQRLIWEEEDERQRRAALAAEELRRQAQAEELRQRTEAGEWVN